MDRTELRTRARGLDLDLQVLAAVCQELWESLQDELDAGADLDPDGRIGQRLLSMATGIPQLGRVVGHQNAPPRAVYVVRARRCVEPSVRGVFLSETRALAWVAQQASPER